MSFLNIGVGFLSLMVGRPAYMSFVGAIGYIVGAYLAERYLLVAPEWNTVAMPLVFGVIGALAALFFRRWAARVAGFLAGGYLLFNFPEVFSASTEWASWPLFLVAGTITVVFLVIWFDFALVILSALVGVTLMLPSINLGAFDTLTMFILLMVFGTITQFILLQYGRPSPD
jgi:hypothetical protein